MKRPDKKIYDMPSAKIAGKNGISQGTKIQVMGICVPDALTEERK